MRRWRVLSLLLLPVVAAAHPLAPALLQMLETAPERYEVVWRASVLQSLHIEPRLPATCRRESEPVLSVDPRGAATARWAVTCAGGLVGQAISVPELDRAGINVILRLEARDGAVQEALLDARRARYTVPPFAAAPGVFRQYLGLGVSHLLTGLDHLLFVAGLVLLVRRARTLLLTVTAFTVGHSLTLALATLGVVQLPPGPMELGIAATLLALACELARPRGEPAGLLARRPALMAGAFGLLHGLGFAGALSEAGLPAGEVPWALFAFNVGIELAQLGVVALLLGLGAMCRRLPVAVVARGPAWSTTVLGSLAAFWVWERAALLLG